MIEKQFAGRAARIKTSVIGGIKTAAKILNFMDSSPEQRRLTDLGKVDEALGRRSRT